MRLTQAELLEIIKEETLKELLGYDVEPLTVPAQTAEDLNAAHGHMVAAMESMEKAKQEALSDNLKDQIQQLQDELIARATRVLEALGDLVGMSSQLGEDLLSEIGYKNYGAEKSPAEETNYPDFAPGEELIPAYVEESQRNSAIQGLVQAQIALQKVKGQQDAAHLVADALNKLGYDDKTDTLRYYQGNRAMQPEGTYTE